MITIRKNSCFILNVSQQKAIHTEDNGSARTSFQNIGELIYEKTRLSQSNLIGGCFKLFNCRYELLQTNTSNVDILMLQPF